MVTIKQIILYTWKNLRIRNRFFFSQRDILPTKIKIIKKHIYQPMKKGTESFDERLEIQSMSAPQYKPYTNYTKGRKQLKYKHQYDCVISIQKDSKGKYSFDSKIKWRLGSFKKWVDKPSQSFIKTVYRETTNKLKKKYPKKEQYSKYIEEIKKIRTRGKYLNVGDYNAMMNGINGDEYFRNYYLQYINDCLFGPIYSKERNSREPKIKFPFMGKHMIATIFFLIKKGIIEHQHYILK
jgi:hypothetical protein